MSAQIIDGKAIAAVIRDEIKAEVEAMRARYDRVPGLAAVLVGERKDSQTYVRMKKRACAEVAFIADHAGAPELRATFLARPEVLEIAGKPT